jgi:hypothetical protein
MKATITGTNRLDGYNQRQHLIVEVTSPKAKGTLLVHTMATTDRLRVEGTLLLNGGERVMHAGHGHKNSSGEWVGEANRHSFSFMSAPATAKQIELANLVIAEVCKVAEQDAPFNWEMLDTEKYYVEMDLESAQEKIETLKLEVLAQQTLINELEQKVRAY